MTPPDPACLARCTLEREVRDRLGETRKPVSVSMAVDALSGYVDELRRYRKYHGRIATEAKLRRANRRRGPSAPWLQHEPWAPAPELGSLRLQARAWANFRLRCAHVPRALRRWLLDLIEASPPFPTAEQRASL